MKTIGNEKYCLNNKVKVLWVDKTFDLAKISFIDERREYVVLEYINRGTTRI